jgi:hypothetical protein
MFCYECAAPEQVDEAALAAALFEARPRLTNRLLKTCKPPAGYSKDIEEFVPESLSLRAFCAGAFPLTGESKCSILDFI